MIQEYKEPKDESKRGRVTRKVDGNHYEVQIQGTTYKIKSNFTFEVNENVLVLFPQGRSTDLYIYPNR